MPRVKIDMPVDQFELILARAIQEWSQDRAVGELRSDDQAGLDLRRELSMYLTIAIRHDEKAPRPN